MLTRRAAKLPKKDQDKYPVIHTVTNNSISMDSDSDNINTTVDIHNAPASTNPPTNTNNTITPVRPSSGIHSLPADLLKSLKCRWYLGICW